MNWRPDYNSMLQDEVDCRVLAVELFDLYGSNYPLFWEIIDYDKEKLVKIFQFFGGTRRLLLNSPRELMDFLKKRLAARDTGGPPPIPFDFKTIIEEFSAVQISLFQKLGPLIGPAFELFTANALTPSKQYRQNDFEFKEKSQPVRLFQEGFAPPLDPPFEPGGRGLSSPLDHPFEPDSAVFFYWAEFGFIAAYAGHAVNEWREILRVLLRSERIYALAYGKPVLGSIPQDTKFSSYHVRNFSRIRPEDARRIPYPPGRRFDELENEATACAHFAFPGGID